MVTMILVWLLYDMILLMFSNYQMYFVRGDGKMPKTKGARNSGASNEGVPMIEDHMLVNKPDNSQKIKAPSPAKKNVTPAQ